MQGARCMDCGIPFCHQGCPLGNIIPEWNDLVWRDDWDGAIERLHATNNFPEFTGRLCPAPCETACVLGINQDPVTIKNVEVAIIDRAWESRAVRPQPPEWLSGKTVAVIGSGPAGLAAAQQLTRVGHTVAVYERADKIGGLLRYGIPEFKMEKKVLDRRLDQMRREGTVFRAGVNVGESLTGDQLIDRYDAVVLAIGATAARDLPVPGRELGGIHLAMSFLRGNTRRLLDGGVDAEPPISAEGRDVIVIGGGDTGTDCVGTSIRQGAKSVRQLELLARPPLARAADNPWPEWPKVYKLDYGQEEAQALWGEDPRRYSTTTRRFIGRNEHVTGVEIADLSWQPGPDGRIAMREVPGTTQVIPADLVLLALGFTGPEPALPKAFDCELDPRGNVRTGADRMTSVPGVFAAGDCVRGQSLVVWAIKEGRQAAEGVDRYLSRVV